jgi:hypothetical protein
VYSQGSDYLILVLEIFVFGVFLVNGVREVWQFWSDRRGWLRDRWNWNDAATLVTAFVVIIIRFTNYGRLGATKTDLIETSVPDLFVARNSSLPPPAGDELLDQTTMFDSMWRTAFHVGEERKAAALLLILVWLGLLVRSLLLVPPSVLLNVLD